ncbi:class I SAM-dependent methyltransferase [Candidatus Pelagibacter sp.]|jgi:hypothetical protein|nr:class I SAM-dependent methyltransferase [Candidatus Pelagibacter sp.]
MINKKTKTCFLNSPYSSTKHDSYFDTYDELFSKYVGQEITFVEIGVLNGGSLFMWRDYFGQKARIIGIDNNSNAKYWEKYGFEIFIGNQSDKNFWQSFKDSVGKVDILLDDGGHVDYQQTVTLFENINNINENGLIVIEDVHSSYMKEFGNPSKFSFTNLVSKLIDRINYRSTHLNKNFNFLKLPICEIRIFESIYAFRINSQQSNISNQIINDGKFLGFKDLRHSNTSISKVKNLIKKILFLKDIPIIGNILKNIYIKFIREKLYSLYLKKEKKKFMKKYFND